MTKPTSTNVSKPLLVTAGEPAGIGPELCLALAGTRFAREAVIVADPRALEARAERLNVACKLQMHTPGEALASTPDTLNVWPHELPNPTVCGHPDPVNSRALLSALEVAVRACEGASFSALVTAPLQKSAIADAGIAFTGHTEYLAALTNTPVPVMLLVADRLRVALATTHMPLSNVPAHITENGLYATLKVLDQGLKARFAIHAPQIVVCGLNPHAGENGHLGSEDDDVIAPAVERCRAAGIDARGPLPADTAFTPAGGHADAILAMYHDQGLPVLKYAGFGKAVNVTLGLPIVRTSVDHGTALDIAGKGQADCGSFFAAIELARTLEV